MYNPVRTQYSGWSVKKATTTTKKLLPVQQYLSSSLTIFLFTLIAQLSFFFHLIFLVLHLIHLVLKCCKNFVELFSGYYSPKFLNELLLYNGRKEAKNILLNNNIKEKHIFCSCSSSVRFY